MSRHAVLLFDLDGTLTRSGRGITRSVQYALSKFGIAEPDPEALVDFIGPPLADSFMRRYAFDRSAAKQAVLYYREYYERKGMFENELYPGVSAMLSALRSREERMMIATSKPTVYAEKVLDHFGIRSSFAEVIGSELDGTRALKTEVLGELLSRLAPSDRRRCVMIGDRKHDVLAAADWQLPSIAVTYGFGSRAELEEARPTYIAHSVKELLSLILQL